jgi:pimeloyl-ACP methyl ester carboxylesterase
VRRLVAVALAACLAACTGEGAAEAGVRAGLGAADGRDRLAAVGVRDGVAAGVVVRGYALLDAAGDTVAVERVEAGPGWLEVTLVARRRNEVHRLVLDLGANGAVTHWDAQVTSRASPLARRDRWRVFVTPDSLLVLRGALIGDAVSVDGLAVAPPVSPWHELSVGLLDAALQRAGDSVALIAGLAPGVVRTARVERPHPDSARLTVSGDVWEVAIGDDGHVVSGQTRDRTRRAARVPADALAAAWPLAEGGDAPSTAALDEETVVLRAEDGVRLVGTLVRPRRVARPPVVLFVSGSGPQDRDLGVPGFDGYRPFAELAAALAARGVASVRVDDRGAGASGGSAFRATHAGEAADVRAVHRWVAERGDLDAARVGLVGHSDGGHVALAVAAADARVRTVVLLGTPVQSGRDLASAQRASAQRASAPRAAGDVEPSIARLEALDAWLRDWLAFDPRAVRDRLSTAVLVVHGTADRQVPVAQAEELAALLVARGAVPVEVARLPGVNHLLRPEPTSGGHGAAEARVRALAPEVSAAVIPWLVRHLGTSSDSARDARRPPP